MIVTADTWRAFGQQFVDEHYAYCIDCDRCGGSCHCLDCSGLQCRISNGLGITRGYCTTSFVIFQQCWDAGLFMDQATAEADSGPDVFYAAHGANFGRTDDGSQPNGASGHIVTVVRVRNPDGTTNRFYTIEAMGHAYGVVNGTYENRGWTGRYRIPGVVDAPPAPKVKPLMAEQLNARLYNRQTGGWFEGYPDGRVDYLAPIGAVVHGGMVSDADKSAFTGRMLSRLEGRWYIRHKDKRHIFGFTIRATSNETYEPEAAH